MSVGEDVTTVGYPMARPPRCPFDPPSELAELAAGTPIMRVKIWDGSTPWLVTRYDDLKTLFNDRRLSVRRDMAGFPLSSPGQAVRNEVTRLLVAMDEPQHSHHRRMLSAEFTKQRSEALRPEIERSVRTLLDDMARSGPPADLVGSFASLVPSRTISHMLGIPEEDHEFFDRHLRSRVDLTSDRDAVRADGQAIREYFGRLVDRRLEEFVDDVLGRLVRDWVHTGQIGRDNVVGVGEMLFVGAYVTTASTIGLGTFLLLQNPDQARLIREGDEATGFAAVDELLRYLTVNHMGRRRVAIENIEIGGVIIKAGDGVVLAAELGNRDPSVYEDPNAFKVRRSSNNHLTFGWGTHHCMGRHLARIELQLAFSELFRRFPSLRLAVPAEDVEVRRHHVIYGVHSLPVEW